MQKAAFEKSLLACELIALHEEVTPESKYLKGFFVCQAEKADTVYGEHERFQRGINVADIGSCLDKPCLQCRGMGDFQERVDIVEVDLPKFEDLRLLRMEM